MDNRYGYDQFDNPFGNASLVSITGALQKDELESTFGPPAPDELEGAQKALKMEGDETLHASKEARSSRRRYLALRSVGVLVDIVAVGLVVAGTGLILSGIGAIPFYGVGVIGVVVGAILVGGGVVLALGSIAFHRAASDAKVSYTKHAIQAGLIKPKDAF